jgi:hypothetical protein
MNKTLKTIAWICLVMGLLGMVVDAGALIVGRTIMSNRLVIAEQNNAPANGNNPQFKQPLQPGNWQPGFRGMMGRGGMMSNFRGRFNGGRIGLGAGIFLLFFMALGPVLAIVGAVILLVHREPKNVPVKEEKDVKKDKEEKEEKKKDSKK